MANVSKFPMTPCIMVDAVEPMDTGTDRKGSTPEDHEARII